MSYYVVGKVEGQLLSLWSSSPSEAQGGRWVVTPEGQALWVITSLKIKLELRYYPSEGQEGEFLPFGSSW